MKENDLETILINTTQEETIKSLVQQDLDTYLFGLSKLNYDTSYEILENLLNFSRDEISDSEGRLMWNNFMTENDLHSKISKYKVLYKSMNNLVYYLFKEKSELLAFMSCPKLHIYPVELMEKLILDYINNVTYSKISESIKLYKFTKILTEIKRINKVSELNILSD